MNSIKSISLITVILMLLPAAVPSSAESKSGPGTFAVVHLKSKGVLKGLIKGETDKKVIMDLGFGRVEIWRSDIDKIEIPGEKEKNAIAAEYKKHVLAVRHNIKNRAVYRDMYNDRMRKDVMLADKNAKEETVIKFADPKRIFVRVVLNDNVGTELLVDTGAGLVCISPALAGKLGITPSPGVKKIDLKLADGTITHGIPVVLDDIRIKDADAENVPAVIAKCGEKYGILGMSFLGRFNVNIDTEKKELTLREK